MPSARQNPPDRTSSPKSRSASHADSLGASGGAQLPSDMLTVAHLVESFAAQSKMLVRAGVQTQTTHQWYQDQFKHLAPLGSFPAEALRVHHLATIEFTNGFVRALKRLYKWAVEGDLVPKDPFAKLAIPPCGRRERTLTHDEMRRLYLAASPAFRRLLFVQRHTIARPGEIRNLRWDQIDFANRVILLVEFKGKKRRRDQLRARAIPLDLPVLRMLRNMHRRAGGNPAPDARVFRDTRGRPWTPNGVRCAMRRARAKAGLLDGGERVVLYTLRHTGATEAIRADANLAKVAAVMGHARTSTTERYVHLNTADLVGTIDRVSASRRRPPAATPAA